MGLLSYELRFMLAKQMVAPTRRRNGSTPAATGPMHRMAPVPWPLLSTSTGNPAPQPNPNPPTSILSAPWLHPGVNDESRSTRAASWTSGS